jgi:hypothetical protein
MDSRGRSDFQRPVLSERLIDSLRQALNAGLTCDEIAAAVLMQAGLIEMSSKMDGEELVGRCREIHRVLCELRKRGLEEGGRER